MENNNKISFWSPFNVEILDVYTRHHIPIDGIVRSFGRSKEKVLKQIAKNTIQTALNDKQTRDCLKAFMTKVSSSSTYLNEEDIQRALAKMSFLDVLKYSGAVDEEKESPSPLQVETTQTETTSTVKQTPCPDEVNKVPQFIKDTCIYRDRTGKFCTNKRADVSGFIGSYLCTECMDKFPQSFHVRNRRYDQYPALIFYNLTDKAASDVRKSIPYNSVEAFKYVLPDDQLILVMVFGLPQDAESVHSTYNNRIMYGKKVLTVPYNVDMGDDEADTSASSVPSIEEKIQSYLKEKLREAVNEFLI